MVIRDSVIVEMIDELPAKITIRKVAEAHGVPVVTATGMDLSLIHI